MNISYAGSQSVNGGKNPAEFILQDLKNIFTCTGINEHKKFSYVSAL